MRQSKPRGRLVLRVAIAVLASVAAALVFVIGSIVFFALGRQADFAEQRDRLKTYAVLPVDAVASSLAADRSLSDELPFDSLRMIATHNSYRKRADPLRLFFIELAQRGEAAKLDYAHPPLWNQLESGVRSFELDLRLRKGRIECAHVPLVDDRSTEPDFSLALRELALWSDRRPGHVPIVLLLELKDDYRFLDSDLEAWTAAGLEGLDAVIRNELGTRLFTSEELRGDSVSPAAAVAGRGWPLLGSLRNRILVVLHENAIYRTAYLSRAAASVATGGRAMFTSLSGDDAEALGVAGSKVEATTGQADVVFVIDNESADEIDRIRALTSAHYVVRTRADADGTADPAVLAAALASGAQIISTDHPPAYPAADGYTAAFPGGTTLSTRSVR
jgi:hypothetical protein